MSDHDLLTAILLALLAGGQRPVVDGVATYPLQTAVQVMAALKLELAKL